MRSLTPRFDLASRAPPITTWRPGSGRSEAVQVGVTVALDQPARPARPAWSDRRRTGAVHRSPAARSSARVVLPTSVGSDEQDRLGSRTPDFMAVYRDERGRVGPCLFHRTDGQAFSAGAALRGRHGAFGAAAGAASPSAETSGLLVGRPWRPPAYGSLSRALVKFFF